MAVAPLSFFYFHQFPGLFLISNLLIISFFGVFLVLVMAVFVMLLFDLLPHFMGTFFDGVVQLLMGPFLGLLRMTLYHWISFNLLFPYY